MIDNCCKKILHEEGIYITSAALCTFTIEGFPIYIKIVD